MINYYPKTQFLIILFNVVPLACFKVFSKKKKKIKNKSCHVDKGDQKLYLRVTMSRIS
jgi:hypothetical protein